MRLDPYAKNYSDKADATVQDFAGFTTPGENFQAELGFVIDEELISSADQDPESTYTDDASWENAFGVLDAVSRLGVTQTSVRNNEIRSKLEEGIIPQRMYDAHTTRRPRAGNETDWDAIIMQMREEMPELDLGFETSEEMLAANTEILADRRGYVEDIRERQTTGGWWAGLGGGMVGSVMDPVQSAAMILSAPVSGTMKLSRAAYAASMGWRTAALEVGIQIPTELFIHSWKEEIGSEYTWRDSATNLVASGIFAGTIGTAVGLGSYRAPGVPRTAANDKILATSTDKAEVQKVMEDAGIDADSADVLSESIVEINSAKVDPPEVSFKERATADGFETDQNWYHSNKGGIEGGEFDNSRLPRNDPDSPFNAHWFAADADLTNSWRNQAEADTITPVYLKLTKPATMEDLRKIVKSVKRSGTDSEVPLEESYSSRVRQAMDEAGFTHMVWDGRGPINKTVLEETGEVRYKTAVGPDMILRKDEEGYLHMYDPKEGPGEQGYVTGGWENLEEFEDIYPEASSIAMFNPTNIRVDVDHPDFKAMPVEEFMTNIDDAEARINDASYDEFDTRRTEKEMADDATDARLARESSEEGVKTHTSQASFRRDAKERGYVVKKLSKLDPTVIEGDALIALPNKNAQLSESLGEYDIELRHGEIRNYKPEVPRGEDGYFEFDTRQGVLDFANASGLVVEHSGDGHLSVKTEDGKVVGEWNESTEGGFIDNPSDDIVDGEEITPELVDSYVKDKFEPNYLHGRNMAYADGDESIDHPLMLTSKDGNSQIADWYSGEAWDAAGAANFPFEFHPKSTLDLDASVDAVNELLDEIGKPELKLKPDGTFTEEGAEAIVAFRRDPEPGADFEGQVGAIDLAYIPEFRAAAEAKGYDSMYTAKDSVGMEGDIHDTMVPLNFKNVEAIGGNLEDVRKLPTGETEEVVPLEIQGRKTVQNGKVVDEEAEYQALLDEQQRVMDIVTCLNGKSS